MPTKRYGDKDVVWDGFQWVTKTKPIVRNIEHVTDVKKVQISGLPLELGLRADMLKDEFNAQLKEKYNPEKDIIKSVDLILAQNSIAIELGSRDDISKIKDTFDGKKFLEQELRVTSFENKTINFNVTGAYDAAASTSNPIAHTPQTAAQAAAIAKAAIEQIQGEDVKGIFKPEATEKSKYSINSIGTRILKVWNVVDPSYFRSRNEELLELQIDMKFKFTSFGKLVDIQMVMPEKAKIGAEAGSIFAVFEDEAASKVAYQELKASRYDSKVVQAAYVKEEIYFNHLKVASTSFMNVDQLVQEVPAQYQMQPQIAVEVVKEADYEFE